MNSDDSADNGLFIKKKKKLSLTIVKTITKR